MQLRRDRDAGAGAAGGRRGRRAGRWATAGARWLRYWLFRTVPRIATAQVPPIWRMVISRPEPTPARSALSSSRATFMVIGMARPTPTPPTVSQVATKP